MHIHIQYAHTHIYIYTHIGIPMKCRNKRRNKCPIIPVSPYWLKFYVIECHRKALGFLSGPRLDGSTPQDPACIDGRAQLAPLSLERAGF